MTVLFLRWILVLVIAFICGGLIKYLKLPSILGWLIAGMLLGPHALGLLPQELLDARSSECYYYRNLRRSLLCPEYHLRYYSYPQLQLPE